MNELELYNFLDKYEFYGKDVSDAVYNFSTIKCKWIVSRFMYILGTPMLSDGEYTSLQLKFHKFVDEVPEEFEEILEIKELREYLGRVYQDDPIPYGVFSKVGITEEFEDSLVKKYLDLKGYNKIEVSNEEISRIIKDMIDEDPPKSIRPVESIIEAYEWFNTVKGLGLCASLKIDGINLRLFYIEGKLEYCCTRGRSGNTLDYTKVMRDIVPNKVEINGRPFTGKVRGEGYVQPDALQYLREKYPADYVVPRTAAKTMLSVPHYKEDMKYLKFISFNNDVTDKLYDKLNKFEEQGFDIVPKKIITWNGGSIEEFTDWISEILLRMKEWEISNNLKCDGVVVEINDPQEFEKLRQDSNYDSGNLALKLGPWEPEVYESRIESLSMFREENKIQFNCKANIVPVTVSSGITISTVNMFNLGLVQKYNVKVGDKIRFLFKNDNASQWVYEDAVLRLKTQLGVKK